MQKKQTFFRALFITTLFTVFGFLVGNQHISYASSLPDVSYANGTNTYSPYQVNSTIKNTEVGKGVLKKGKKNTDTSDKNNLTVDVYEGMGTGAYKSKMRIVSKTFPNHKKQEYLVFNGYSIMYPYTHHNKNNQVTYIRLVNENGVHKTYLAKTTNLKATNDLWYGGSPACAAGVKDREARKCNMKYEHVGFEAYIPLKDLFDGTDKKWRLFVIKRVQDSGGSIRTLYDQLVLPIDKKKFNYDEGSFTIYSGNESKKMKALYSDISLLKAPRPSSTNKYSGHFTKGGIYTMTGRNDDLTTPYYSFKVNGKKVWNSSSFFHSQGDQAELVYTQTLKTCHTTGKKIKLDQKCPATYTVKHVVYGDKKTVLKTETVSVKEGDTKTFTPKATGFFKNKENNPYEAYPASQKITAKVPKYDKAKKQPANQTFYITYRIKSVKHTLRHIDVVTGSVILSEPITKNVGSTYTYTSKKKGDLKKNGFAYEPSPAKTYTGTTATSNKTFDFHYKINNVTVNINHIIKGTTTSLKKETKNGMLGDSYTLKPNEVIVDSNNKTYVPDPSIAAQTKTGKYTSNTHNFTFTYAQKNVPVAKIVHKNGYTGNVMETEYKVVQKNTETSICPKPLNTFKGSQGNPMQSFDDCVKHKTSQDDIKTITFTYYLAEIKVTVKHFKDNDMVTPFKTEQVSIQSSKTNKQVTKNLNAITPSVTVNGEIHYPNIPTSRSVTVDFVSKEEPKNKSTSFTYSKKTNVSLIVEHRDYDTQKLLKTDTINTLKIGDAYDIKPDAKITVDATTYAPYPTSQVVKGTIGSTTVKKVITYKKVIPKPVVVKEVDGATNGKVKGAFKWVLENNANNDTVIRFTNDLSITGKHFATKNPTYSVKTTGVTKQDTKAISITSSDVKGLKDKEVEYSFSYEYTNHYLVGYGCTLGTENVCFEWKPNGKDTALWDGNNTQKAEFNKTLTINHEYNSSVQLSADNDKIESSIGQVAEYNGDNQSVKEKEFKEKIKIGTEYQINLLTQSWLPIYEKLIYESDLDSDVVIDDKNISYYPNDVDASLKERYEVKTNVEDGEETKYRIPLRVAEKTKNSIVFKSKDNFLITKQTGFIVSTPYTMANPSQIEESAKAQYEAFTEQSYSDTVVTKAEDGSRYYFNIDLNGEEKPGKWYTHTYDLGKIGLSKTSVVVEKKVKFDRFLVGSPVDSPQVSAEFAGVIKGVDYPYSVTITVDQIKKIKKLASEEANKIYSFKPLNDKDKYNRLKQILPSLP